MTQQPVDFRSDNTASVAPAIMDAIVAANRGTAPSYGNDETTRAVDRRLSDLFETEVRVFPVATGTAANAIALSAMTRPWGGIYCHESAHIQTSECGAFEAQSGGAKLQLLPGAQYKITAETLARAIASAGVGQPHKPQPAGVSVTQATDFGTVYRLEELAAIGEMAHGHRLKMHMDGARFANALDTLGCTPAEMTWKIGVDVLSFGATKNGAMSCDAIVAFDPAIAHELVFRLRRAGHVWSKMRFASAQLLAYVEKGLWLDLAHRANGLARRLAEGLAALPGVKLHVPVEANELFVELPDAVISRLEAERFLFARRGPRLIRLVCRHDGTDAEVDQLLSAVKRLLPQATNVTALP
ncbi:MAG: low specificity L-threonine aldolase [Alphaproteobacteria bacterium]|nr:low specificity L-threonine aldolase [Alphaproteobacteria bacterium]